MIDDLLKMRDALAAAEWYFLKRDEMNAAVHLAPQARLSPLTSKVQAERERCDRLIAEDKERALAEDHPGT